MAKKVLSIVIGDEITKVCEISYKKNYGNRGIRVYNSISFPTPADAIEDGFIKHKEVFGQHLRSQLKAAKMKSKKAIFTIASSKIANREVIIPLVKENRIMSIIKTGASEYFPIDIKDYILSYIILEKKTSDRREKAQVKRQLILDAKLTKKQLKADSKTNKKANKKSNNKGETGDFEEPVKAPTVTKLMYNEDTEKPIEDNKRATKIEKTEAKKSKSKKHIRLSVYAVPSNIVKNYYNFADIIGLDVVSIDYSGNSSYQMLKRQTNQGTNVFIQLNEQDTVISILRDNVLILQRTIGYGISNLIETVIEQKCFRVSNETETMELMHLKNLLKLEETETASTLPSWSDIEAAATSELTEIIQLRSAPNEETIARRNIIESLHFLTNSISRMLDYYKNNHRNVVFESIHLSGVGIRILGIDQFFSKEIGINNENMEKLTTVTANKKAKAYRANPSEFMACVGCVIKPVDFVPHELVERQEKFRNIVGAAFLTLVCIGGAAILCYVSYEDYLTAKQDYSVVADQLSAMPSTNDTRAQFDQATLRLANLQEMEVKMQGNQKINEVLSELQKKLLSNASVQNIQFSDTGVVMNIIMSDNNYGANTLVAKLLMQIKTIELFDEVLDTNMSVADDGQVGLTISCTYKENETLSPTETE